MHNKRRPLGSTITRLDAVIGLGAVIRLTLGFASWL
jgi:hypothetical protein